MRWVCVWVPERVSRSSLYSEGVPPTELMGLAIRLDTDATMNYRKDLDGLRVDMSDRDRSLWLKKHIDNGAAIRAGLRHLTEDHALTCDLIKQYIAGDWMAMCVDFVLGNKAM